MSFRDEEAEAGHRFPDWLKGQSFNTYRMAPDLKGSSELV